MCKFFADVFADQTKTVNKSNKFSASLSPWNNLQTSASISRKNRESIIGRSSATESLVSFDPNLFSPEIGSRVGVPGPGDATVASPGPQLSLYNTPKLVSFPTRRHHQIRIWAVRLVSSKDLAMPPWHRQVLEPKLGCPFLVRKALCQFHQTEFSGLKQIV